MVSRGLKPCFMQTDTKLVSHEYTWKIEEIKYLVKGVQYSLAEK